MALQPATAPVKQPLATKVVKAAPGKTVKKAVKAATAAKKETAAANKEKAAAQAVANKAREDAQAARALEHEATRRANALAKIQEAALAAGTQKSRIETFIHKLQLRVERGCERVARLVEQERARQAAAIEKYPSLKHMAPAKKELEAAAAIPEVEIPEDQLPSYITDIKEDAA